MLATSASVTTQPSYTQADYIAWFASSFYGAIKNEMRCLMYQSQIATCDELNEGFTTKHEAMIGALRPRQSNSKQHNEQDLVLSRQVRSILQSDTFEAAAYNNQLWMD
jgi:hypothetical protein